MPITLTSTQNRFLRSQAHDLKATLQTGGKGVTPAFIAELNEVLERYELIKVKVAAADKQERETLIAQLVGESECVLVQCIGHVAILYRPCQDKDKRQIVLPRR